MKEILTTALFLLLSTSAYAASPVIFYSDLEAGPATSSSTTSGNGVYVTVWGNNFGASQGSSTVTVGGGAVASYITWTNTMVCFQLGSSSATGNIVLTTSGGSGSSANSSTPFSFTVQSGNIYFISGSGTCTSSCTESNPYSVSGFSTLYNNSGNSIPTAGDTIYIMSGTYQNEYLAGNNSSYQGIIGFIDAGETINKTGTSGHPISWIGYPYSGDTQYNFSATLKSTSYRGIIWSYGATYQTFAKLMMVSTVASDGNAIIFGGGGEGGITGWQIIGNNITASSWNDGLIDIAGSGLRILGNYIHDSVAAASMDNQDHTIYIDGPTSNFELGWNYFYNNQNEGFELNSYHGGPRTGSMHDNLIVDPTPGTSRGINLGAFDGGDSGTPTNTYNNSYDIFNNVLVNLGVNSGCGAGDNDSAIGLVVGTAYVYNNTIYGSPNTCGMMQVAPFSAGVSGFGPSGGNAQWYVADNIFYATSSVQYITDGSTSGTPSSSLFQLMTKNEYYGNGNGSSLDASPLNSDPKFVTNGSNFNLQSSSPAIAYGYNTNSVVPLDYNGLTRSSSPADGAYEYGTGGGGGGGITGTGETLSHLTFSGVTFK